MTTLLRSTFDIISYNKMCFKWTITYVIERETLLSHVKKRSSRGKLLHIICIQFQTIDKEFLMGDDQSFGSKSEDI